MKLSDITVKDLIELAKYLKNYIEATYPDTNDKQYIFAVKLIGFLPKMDLTKHMEFDSYMWNENTERIKYFIETNPDEYFDKTGTSVPKDNKNTYKLLVEASIKLLDSQYDLVLTNPENKISKTIIKAVTLDIPASKESNLKVLASRLLFSNKYVYYKHDIEDKINLVDTIKYDINSYLYKACYFSLVCIINYTIKLSQSKDKRFANLFMDHSIIRLEYIINKSDISNLNSFSIFKKSMYELYNKNHFDKIRIAE